MRDAIVGTLEERSFDQQNAGFWDMLYGMHLATLLGSPTALLRRLKCARE